MKETVLEAQPHLRMEKLLSTTNDDDLKKRFLFVT